MTTMFEPLGYPTPDPEEPVQWAVLICYDGEVVGTGGSRFTSWSAARARIAELRDRFPRHDIRPLRRTVVWTEEPCA